MLLVKSNKEKDGFTNRRETFNQVFQKMRGWFCPKLMDSCADRTFLFPTSKRPSHFFPGSYGWAWNTTWLDHQSIEYHCLQMLQGNPASPNAIL